MSEFIYKMGTPEFDNCKCQELYKQGKFVGSACGCKICDDCGRWYTCYGGMGLNAQLRSSIELKQTSFVLQGDRIPDTSIFLKESK